MTTPSCRPSSRRRTGMRSRAGRLAKNRSSAFSARSGSAASGRKRSKCGLSSSKAGPSETASACKLRNPRPTSLRPQASRSGPAATGSPGMTADGVTTSPPRGEGKEIAKDLWSLGRQEALRMELDAVQRPLPVPNAHDLSLLGPGGDLEVRVVECVLLDHEAMVARRFERAREPGEHALTVVVDRRHLAVHDPPIADHFAPERVADALVSEADAEDWRRRREPLQHLV